MGPPGDSMPKKKKRLDKGTEARRLARKIAPKPSTTRVVEDKRKKTEKHKKQWTIELEA
jgi:hypothetical protein